MNHPAPVQPLPLAVRLGLAGFAPARRSAAEDALRAAAGPALDDPAFWTASRLTGDGFPFELSFTAHDDSLRWTFDPAALSPCGRWAETAVGALRRLGWRCDPDLLDAALQGARADGFGAWIGGRHGTAGDAFKLYLDWGGAPDPLGLPAPRHVQALTTPMLALGPGETRCEIYHRVEAAPEALANLLAPAGLAALAGDVRRAIETEWGHPMRGRAPGGRIGVSYVSEGGRVLPAVTLFLFARILWGGDARIRRRMLEHLSGAGRDLAPYETATRPLTGRDTAQTRHGMAALTVSDTGLSWGVGLRPATGP